MDGLCHIPCAPFAVVQVGPVPARQGAPRRDPPDRCLHWRHQLRWAPVAAGQRPIPGLPEQQMASASVCPWGAPEACLRLRCAPSGLAFLFSGRGQAFMHFPRDLRCAWSGHLPHPLPSLGLPPALLLSLLRHCSSLWALAVLPCAVVAGHVPLPAPGAAPHRVHSAPGGDHLRALRVVALRTQFGHYSGRHPEPCDPQQPRLRVP